MSMRVTRNGAIAVSGYGNTVGSGFNHSILSELDDENTVLVGDNPRADKKKSQEEDGAKEQDRQIGSIATRALGSAGKGKESNADRGKDLSQGSREKRAGTSGAAFEAGEFASADARTDKAGLFAKPKPKKCDAIQTVLATYQGDRGIETYFEGLRVEEGCQGNPLSETVRGVANAFKGMARTTQKQWKEAFAIGSSDPDNLLSQAEKRNICALSRQAEKPYPGIQEGSRLIKSEIDTVCDGQRRKWADVKVAGELRGMDDLAKVGLLPEANIRYGQVEMACHHLALKGKDCHPNLLGAAFYRDGEDHGMLAKHRDPSVEPLETNVGSRELWKHVCAARGLSKLKEPPANPRLQPNLHNLEQAVDFECKTKRHTETYHSKGMIQKPDRGFSRETAFENVASAAEAVADLGRNLMGSQFARDVGQVFTDPLAPGQRRIVASLASLAEASKRVNPTKEEGGLREIVDTTLDNLGERLKAVGRAGFEGFKKMDPETKRMLGNSMY